MTDTVPTPGEVQQPQTANVSLSATESVRADKVRMHQSLAQEVYAGDVNLQQSAAVEVRAQGVNAEQSALGWVDAQEVSLTNSSAAVIRGGLVGVNGLTGVALGGTVNLDKTYAGLVAGREVRGERIDTLFLLGNHVEGQVHTVVDARTALLGGLVGGLFAGLMLLLGRMLFRRD